MKTEELIKEYEDKINELEQKSKDHRKLCTCGACELLVMYSKLAAKYRLHLSWESWSELNLLMEIDKRMSNLVEWAQNSVLSDAKVAEIDSLGSVFDVFRRKINVDNLDADPDPCTFNNQDLEDLTISLVDGILAGISKEEPLPDPSYSKEGFYNALRRAIHYRTDKALKDYFGSELEKTEAGCIHDYEWSNHCGAKVCSKCGDHKGLAKCFCGYGLAPGEVLDDDVPY